MSEYPYLGIDNSSFDQLDLFEDETKYDIDFETKNYHGNITNDWGWFEHFEWGEDYGGSLWFESKILTDYDGVAELPEQIIEKLEELGFDMEWAK